MRKAVLFSDRTSSGSLAAAVFFLPFSKSAAEIFVAAALALWIPFKISAFAAFKKKPVMDWTSACYAVFGALTLFSLLQVPSEHLVTGLRGVLRWSKYLLVFWMAGDLGRDPRQARRWVTVFLLSSLLLALNGFYQIIAGTDLVKNYSVDIPGRLVRMKSSLSSPNDLATFLMLAIPLAFFLWLRRRRWDLLGMALAAALALFCLAFVMTLSRAAFFSLVLASLVYIVARRKKGALLGMLLVAATFLGSGVLRDNFLTTLSWDDITIGERLRFWKISWAMIREHPFLGHGVNMFTLKFPLFAPAGETYRGYAHNCYLQMWSEIGLLGLLAFLAPLARAFWNFLKERKEAVTPDREAAFVWALAFCLQAFFDTQFYAMQTALLFWIFWGLLKRKSPGVSLTPSLQA